VTSGHDYDDVADLAVFSLMGLRLRRLAADASPRNQGQNQSYRLLFGRGPRLPALRGARAARGAHRSGKGCPRIWFC